MADVIAAVSTGNQISAIGIIRLSGEGCAQVADRIFKRKNGAPLADAPARKLVLGELHDVNNRVIDQCMAVYTPGPHSYTGEDTVEFHCHGSPAVLAAGLDALYRNGARPAARGEFTKRAFLNGKLSLTEAEAVADLIEAGGEQSLRSARTAMKGSLYRKIRALTDRMLEVSGHISAYLDYP